MASQERTVVIGHRVLRDLRTSWGKQDIVRGSLRALVLALHSPSHDNHGSEEDLNANDPSLRRIVFSYPAPFTATATKTDDPLDYVRVSVLVPKVIELDFDPNRPGGGSGAALPSGFWTLLEDLNVINYGNPSGPVTGDPLAHLVGWSIGDSEEIMSVDLDWIDGCLRLAGYAARVDGVSYSVKFRTVESDGINEMTIEKLYEFSTEDGQVKLLQVDTISIDPITEVPETVMSKIRSLNIDEMPFQDLVPQRIQNHNPCEIGDVSADGCVVDLLRFSESADVQLRDGGETLHNTNVSYVWDQNWISQFLVPRVIADVDGDGYADIIGFGHSGVQIDLEVAQCGDCQSDNSIGMFDLRQLGGLDTVDGRGGSRNQIDTPHMVGNINGDGRADIVAFDDDGSITIRLGDGDDILCAPDRTDYPIGRSGDNILVSGHGHDPIDGGSGDDELLTGSTGEADSLSRYSGDDHLWGNTGDDWIIISGGTGIDVIRGYDGNDRIGGHYGDNRLAGYGGNDIVHCGNGADIIERCSSDNISIGGHGHDVIYVDARHGADPFCFHLVIGDDGTMAKMRNPKDLAEMGDQYTHSDTKRSSIAGEEHLRSMRGPNDRVFLKNDWSELWNPSRPIDGGIDYSGSHLDG